jgi:hypothetical protein
MRLLGAAVRPEIRIGDGTARTSVVVHPTSQKPDAGYPVTSIADFRQMADTMVSWPHLDPGQERHRMDADAINARLVSANRLRCVTLHKGQRFRLRIEDVDGVALTDFVELSRRETQDAVWLSTSVAFTRKENLIVLGDGNEDYRLPIVDEHILRSHLYPERS